MGNSRNKQEPTKLSRLVTFTSLHKHLTALVVVALFGIVGSSLVFLTQAFGDSASISSEHPLANNSHLSGENFSLPFGGSIDIAAGTPKQVLVQISYAGTKVQPQKPLFTCGTAYSCTRSNYSGPSSGYSSSYVICLDVAPGPHATAPIFTTHFKADADLQPGGGWLAYVSGIAPGTCASNPTAAGIVWGGGEGACGSSLQYPCAQGPGPGRDPDITGDNGITGSNINANGNTDNGNGAVGGSGGSSVNKQSNQPNTIPSSTSQGTESSQQDLEPSPFFDGKQYEPGSDPDILGVNTTFSVAGHNLKYGWIYVLIVLVAGGIGYCIWKRPKFLARLRLPGFKLK